MALFLLLVIAIGLINIKINLDKDGYYKDYLAMDKTTAIKGFFILWIFVTHCQQYVDIGNGLLAKLFTLLRTVSGQSVVTCFFFYSGYGIIQSLLKKGKIYLDEFPYKRIIKTMLHFDVAVIIYIILSLFVKQKYQLSEYVLAFIGYRTVGNSAWFIFDILAAYTLFWISFKLCEDYVKALKLLTVLSVGFIVVMIFVQESYYYNTFITFVMGCWYSYYKDKIEEKVQKKDSQYWLTILGLTVFYLVSGVALMPVYDKVEFLYSIMPATFAILLVLLTMKVQVFNSILLFFGKISFSLFIMMRIPMIILDYLKYSSNQYIFGICTFISSVVLAYLFDKCISKLDSLLFK